MNHTSDAAPLVRSRRGPARRPVRRLVPVARPGRRRAPTASRCRRTTGSRSSAARAGSGSRRAGSSTTTRSWSSSRSWTGGRRPSRRPSSRWSAAGWSAASTASGSTSSTSSSRTRTCRRTRPGRAASAWDRQVHLLRPRPARLPGPDRPVPGDRRRGARPDVGRRAVRRDDRDGGRPDRPIATSCSTGSCSRRPWTAAAVRAAIASARGGLRADRWPTVGPLEPRSAAARLAPRRPRSAARDRDADRPGRGGPAADRCAGRRSCTTARRSGCGDVDIPPEESVDPPAARVGPDFDWWDRSRCRTPMPWTAGPGRRVHDRPAVAAARAGRRRPATSQSQAARSGLGPVALSPADRAAGGDAGPPGRDASASHPDATGDVVAYTRETGRTGRPRRPQPRPRRRPPGGCRTCPGSGGWRPVLGTAPEPTPADDAIADRVDRRSSAPDEARHLRGDRLTSTRDRPCYHDGRSIVSARRGAPRAARFPEAQGQCRMPPRRRPAPTTAPSTR